MTEAEWLNATDATPMLKFLRKKSRASPRKLRLFALACCYRINRHLTNPAARNALQFIQEHAEEEAVKRKGWANIIRVILEAKDPRCLITYHANNALASAMDTRPYWAAAYAAAFSSWAVAWEAQAASGVSPGAPHALRRPEQEHQATLIRDIFGNPFRSESTIERATLAWNDGTVARLATAIYDDRAFDRMPILTDALEEAGCGDQAIIGHCRHEGTVHVRGCHVIDWLLGKR